MLDWKDVTSYSRNEKERVPSILECNIRGLRIVIHRIRHCDGWYLSCYKLDIENQELASIELEEAKIEGLKIVIRNISLLEEIKNILRENI